MKSMISHGAKYGVSGVLNTDWGDFGHINLLSNSIPGAIFGAALSWNTANDAVPTDEDISRLEYGDVTGRTVGLLRELSRHDIIDWDTVVLWYYNENKLDTGTYGYENTYLPAIRDSSEENVLKAYNKINELAMKY